MWDELHGLRRADREPGSNRGKREIEAPSDNNTILLHLILSNMIHWGEIGMAWGRKKREPQTQPDEKPKTFFGFLGKRGDPKVDYGTLIEQGRDPAIRCPSCNEHHLKKSTTRLGMLLSILLFFVIGPCSLFFLLKKETKCKKCGHVVTNDEQYTIDLEVEKAKNGSVPYEKLTTSTE